MKWRFWQDKILLILRIKKQTQGSLSRQVYEAGKANKWPGLGKEVSEICHNIGIPDVNGIEVSKSDVKEAIFNHHYADMKREMEEGYTKMKDIKDDNFTEVQSYFKEKSIETTRMAFRVRCKMVKDIPGNFKQKYKKEGLTCKYCNRGNVMSQAHCYECSAWSGIRKGLDLP